MTLVFDQPYEFVPPHRGNGWPSAIQRLRLVDRYLRRKEGVVDHECRGLEHFREALDRGDGILLAPWGISKGARALIACEQSGLIETSAVRTPEEIWDFTKKNNAYDMKASMNQPTGNPLTHQLANGNYSYRYYYSYFSCGYHHY